MKKEEIGTHGELVNDMMHPQRRAVFPSLGSTACIHVNPIDGYQCSDEFRAQLNLTEKPKRSDHTCKACPVTCSCQNGCSRSLEKQQDCCRGFKLCSSRSKKWVSPWYSGQLFNQTTSTSETKKKASSSLYLDELQIQKCKFRRRFTANC